MLDNQKVCDSLTDDQRFECLLNWFRVIHQQAQRLAVDHYIFRKTQEIIGANESLREMESEFFRWMRDNFIISAAVAVRRQADARDDVISMKRFLKELRDCPHLITRSYFVGLHQDPNLPPGYADGSYNRIVGQGRQVLDPEQIQREIDELDARTSLIKKLVNKKFAHTDEEGEPQVLPTFNDLEACIEYFEDLVQKYSVLLHARYPSGLLPTFQNDWMQVFTLPWIDPESARRG